MGKKNLDRDFLSVKEFAEFAGIKASSLRHYDRKGIFCAAKRGEAMKNEYRYYSPMQITMVKMIRVLTEIGVPLGIIKVLMKERSPEKMLKLFSMNRDRVADEIRFLNEVHLVINTFTELLNEGISAMEDEITVSRMPERRIILGGMNDFRGEGFLREYLRFCNDQNLPKLNMSFPVGGYFKDMDTFLKEPSRPTRFFTIDPKGEDVKPAGLYMVGYTRGYYGETNDLPERMAVFAKKNGLVLSGAVYNIYLSDEVSEVNPERYLLQASIPVIETRRVHSRRPKRKYKYM